MRSIACAPILLLAVLAGCATKDNIEPPAPLESFPATLEVSRAWSVTVGGAGRVRVALVPASDGRQVYVAGRGGRVLALAPDSGRRVWEVNLDAPLAGGPAVGSDIVVVGGSDGRVFALSPATGAVLWTAQLSSDIMAPPAVDRGVVVARTGDGRLYGLDAGDGGQLWMYEQPVPLLSLRGTAGPVIHGDLVISGFDNGRVAANLVRDGQLLWEATVGIPVGRTEIERMVDVNAAPRVIGRDVYAVSHQGRLVALSLESGRILWSRDISSSAGLGVAMLGVWVTDDHSIVTGFDRLSGNELWRQDAMRARWMTAPTPVRDALALGDLEGFVHFLSQDTGALLARVRVGNDSIQVAPVVIGDLVLVQTSGGTVAAYRVGD
ncbi:MAG: outer membrane protein assembly factor BamB [Xanthomonadaceae bacterium]|nr:outer membrane protein assembly factor BamB [Xanthomonadaceae bacterium]